MTYAWLYLLIANLIRRFDLELYETTPKNVDYVRDCFNGQTVPGFNLIKVKVVGERK